MGINPGTRRAVFLDRGGVINLRVIRDSGYEEPRPEHPDAIVRSLPEAADWILSRWGSQGS